VIVPDVTPAVRVCADVVYTNWLADAAVTVSACVADVSGLSAAVNTGVPDSVSLYLKLALLAPLPIVTLVTVVVPPASRKLTPDGAVELVVNNTVCVLVAVATLPYASSNCTVIVPDVTPAVNVCADVVYTSLAADAAVTVSACVAVAVVNALSVTVSTGFPASVSLYVKFALLEPLAIVTLVMVVVPPALRKCTPDGAVELVASNTVCALAAVATLLDASSSVTVMVVEVTPAVSVCTDVV
jgi:hypothetical protein